MSAAVAAPKSMSKHADMSSGDQSFEKFFDEVIASPELNLLDDVFAEEIDQKPDIHHLPPPHPQSFHPSAMSHHHPHPILHRLQPVPPPPLSILKPHVLQPTSTITPPSSGSGGISPTLTWSGDPSPVDHDSHSPTLNDPADVDGEEWKPHPTLFPSTSSRRSSTGSRGRERVNISDAVVVHNGGGSSSAGHGHHHDRSSRSLSTSTSADGGDELTMSQLSIQQNGNGTASLAMISSSTSPPGAAGGLGATPRATSNPRKKTRTNSSSRSSISSIDALISEAMGGGSAPAGNGNGGAGAGAAAAGANNRLIPTGHRRNITSASLVPLDAPTQVRNYLTPSSTSKKEIPSAFLARRNKLKARETASTTTTTGSKNNNNAASPTATTTTGRKRTREEAGLRGDDEHEHEHEHVDELQDDDIDALDHLQSSQSQSQSQSHQSTQHVVPEVASESSSLLSAIEAKRRQNTLAARRSRQRKLDYVRNLEELVAALTKERDSWKTRAENAEKVLGYIPGEDDMDEDDED